MKIFYSWQSDLDKRTNLNFIGNVLERVAKDLSKDELIDVIPVIDRDTKGTIGSPDIVSAILEKIDSIDIFVCDVSIINSKSSESEEWESRPTPNPNVLFELGYAARSNHWENTVLIINTAYGGLELLPFDINHRRMATYNLPPDFDDETRAREREKLRESLGYALRLIITERQVPQEVRFVFQNELEHIKRIAFTKPEFWEYRLTNEFLRHGLRAVRLEYTNVINGIFFKSFTIKTPKQILTFLQEKLSEVVQLLQISEIFINEHIPASWGEPGKSGDAIKIKVATDNFIRCYRQAIEWETDILSVIAPEIFENLIKLLKGSTKYVVDALEEYAKILSEVFNQPEPKGEYDFTIKIEIPEEWTKNAKSEMEKITDWVNVHPEEWE